MNVRERIVAEAREWLGTPWQHQARRKGVGVDCVGLIIGVARHTALVRDDGQDITGYSRTPDGTSLIALCDKFMARIQIDAMQVADVIVLRFGIDPQHMAILADYAHGGLSMLHALWMPAGTGKVVEHRLAPVWRARITHAYRLPGVEA